MATNRALIDHWFAADAVEDIVASLSSSSAASTSHDQERKLASQLLSAMRASSPTSMKVTLAAMRRAAPRHSRHGGDHLPTTPTTTTTTTTSPGPGPGPEEKLETPKPSLRQYYSSSQRPSPSSLAECLRSELCMVAACLARDDFYEGVRARLVDKGKGAPPAWQPGELARVSAAAVSSDFFAPETGEVEAVVRRFEAAVGLLVESGESQRGVTRGGLSPRL